MSVFSEAEIRYLTGGRQLGRLAAAGADCTPHVVPVGWIYAARDTIDVDGHELKATKKLRGVDLLDLADSVLRLVGDLLARQPAHVLDRGGHVPAS
jgi:hypothetical protein